MMQPHESGALCTARCTAESADRQPGVIIRVPLLLVPFSGLYSYASAASRHRVLNYGFSSFLLARF